MTVVICDVIRIDKIYNKHVRISSAAVYAKMPIDPGASSMGAQKNWFPM